MWLDWGWELPLLVCHFFLYHWVKKFDIFVKLCLFFWINQFSATHLKATQSVTYMHTHITPENSGVRKASEGKQWGGLSEGCRRGGGLRRGRGTSLSLLCLMAQGLTDISSLCVFVRKAKGKEKVCFGASLMVQSQCNFWLPGECNSRLNLAYLLGIC